jgi:diacylglycerol O-acyltransferase-1
MASGTSTAVNVPNGHLTHVNGSPPPPSTTAQHHPQAPSTSTPSNAFRSPYQHTYPVHSVERASLFSQDAPVAPSSLGFRNLMGLLIIISNVRLMMDNFQKYGILVTLSGSHISLTDWKCFCALYILTPLHLLVAFGVEMAASKYAKGLAKRIKEEGSERREQIVEQMRRNADGFFTTWSAIAWCHGLNATFMLASATYVVYHHIHNPGLGTIAELHAVVVWLKVCSYALTNRDLRQCYLKFDSDTNLPELYAQCPYPDNINFLNLCYFWWAPTLVYQPVYPRAPKRRWLFIFKRCCEFVILSIVIWLTCAQYAVPLLRNSVDDISKLRGFNILERVMKLSTISLVCWLAGFFALFQSFLNMLAEIMRFGDREFYGDWWNSSDVRSYWTSWNKPVTNFMRRHVYVPLVGRGISPRMAQCMVFVFSGVLHEALVGVPTHNILGFAFVGMVGQMPLIIVTDTMKIWWGTGPNAKLAGNLVFWSSFCIFGQPLAAMAYFFAWQAKYGDVNTRPEWPELGVIK